VGAKAVSLVINVRRNLGRSLKSTSADHSQAANAADSRVDSRGDKCAGFQTQCNEQGLRRTRRCSRAVAEAYDAEYLKNVKQHNHNIILLRYDIILDAMLPY
jgi:hypothetical protein